MKHLGLAVLLSVTLVIGSISSWAEQPKSKAPDQGYVPEGWQPHEGGLLKYRVAIRFGEEPDTMPEGWKFGRVSAVTTDSQGDVYVFHRGKQADAVVVFDTKGNYLRSWGRNFFGNPHGLRAKTTTSGRWIMGITRCTSSRARASCCKAGASKDRSVPTTRPSTGRPT